MISRRNFLKLSALAAPGALSYHDVFAQAESIAFGCPVPMSGPFAANGKFADMGMKLACRSTARCWARAPAVTLDTEGKPATAVRKMQETIEKGTRFFAGGILSSRRWPWARSREGRRRLHHHRRRRRDHRQDCNRATFRWSVPTFGAIEQTVRPLLEKLPKAKRWYTITPQYVFGEGLLSAAKNIFKEKGIEHVGNSYHSLTEKEFSGYLTNAMAAKPDVLLLLNFGSQSSDTLRQAVSFGMKKNCTILIAWASGLEQFETLGADICDGVYFGAQYWHAIDSPFNKESGQAGQRQVKINPNYSLAGSYICTKIILDAIIKAGSTDPKAVIAAMEGMKYEGLTGTEEIRKGDHQVSRTTTCSRARPRRRWPTRTTTPTSSAPASPSCRWTRRSCKL
jgi:branched-chain amino acid transport system substrate-binding protein